MIEDWSSRHVIFGEDVPRDLRGNMLIEPRFWQQYFHRHLDRSALIEKVMRERESRHDFDGDGPFRGRKNASRRDWTVSLGGGSGGTISGPAKFGFDVNAAPDCTRDFVVTGVSVAGSAGQANIIGLNHLYTNTAGNGLCSGTTPNVIFAYTIGTGTVPSIIALSLDGTKIAFTENNTNSNFHVLRFQTAAGNGTSATAPAVPGVGNTAVDTKIPLNNTSSTGPFVDYLNDVAYVCTGSVVHKIRGVFNSTPTEVTTGGWPATIPGNPGISTPVYDGVSKHVFVTDGTGHIDYVDDSVNPVVIHSGTSGFAFASTGITAAPVVVDSTRQKVYAFAGNPNGANAVVAQADTSLTAGSRVITNVGNATSNFVLEGDFNNAYYSNGASASSFLYVVGATGGTSAATRQPALYNIGFNAAFKLNGTTANGPRVLTTGTTTGLHASPLTEFYNTTLARDFLFVGVSGSCTSSGGTGCIRSLNITTGFPTAAALAAAPNLAATGGTGMITVDNASASLGASDVYYTTLAGNTIVKATQLGLQ
jgi:hypothetical protein